MQYLLSVIDDTADLATPDETAVAGDPNPESRMLDAFNDRLVAEGYWVFSGGPVRVKSNETQVSAVS